MEDFIKPSALSFAPCAWRSLLETALQKNTAPEHSFAQLATVRPDGRPANRTLAYRQCLPDNRLVFTTDTRTEKIQDIAHSPLSELCWYLPTTREQFRISGRASLVLAPFTGDMAVLAEALWQARSEASRQSFTWPSPAERRAEVAAFMQPVSVAIPPLFALLLLEPAHVDYLSLATSPHTRSQHARLGRTWTERAVNP